MNWYPWGKEAFTKAKAEDRPIFLSIGYSTCHWCHVMEHESFEDTEAAQLLNENYICIKVDREERPDIDSIYMTVCQVFTGQGGWPLTILMTPEQKPFFAGTYFPKRNRYGAMGLMELLDAVTSKWKQDKKALMESGEEITRVIQQKNIEKGEPSLTLIEQAKMQFENSYDSRYGGFGGAPKFPTPHNLLFLLRYAHQNHKESVLKMVETTLHQMYLGGIFDHIGYGFSRYSTDQKWLVPHFEKMLYDNALLTFAYLEAYQVTKKKEYQTAAQRIITYVLRELKSEQGGFYCAQDADSEGVEGKYYVFTPQEVISLLGEAAGNQFNQCFDITEQGNFEGKNIPNLIKNDAPASTEDWEDAKEILYQYRLTRAKLHKDDKILTSWNALMIAALAKAYQVLHEDMYLQHAQKALEFLEEKLTDKNGRLCVRYREGETAGNGNLDDYAFTVWAYLCMYQTNFDVQYLKKAVLLANQMISLFWDEEGGFYLYGSDAEQLISRPKEVYDGAVPSGNSVAGYVLILLSRLTADTRLNEISQKQLEFLCGKLEDYPAGHCFALMAVQLALYPSKEIICVEKDGNDETKLASVLGESFLPNMTALVKNAEELDSVAPFTKPYSLKDGQTTFYVCENNACSAPFHDISKIFQP